MSSLRQNPIDKNNGNESNYLRMGSPDVTVSQEISLEEVKDEPVETELENLSVDSISSEEALILKIFKFLIAKWNQL